MLKQNVKKTSQKSRLERRLERHINPERSRHFEPERWERSRQFLSELAREDWLSGQGQLRIHIVGSNGKGSLAWYLADLAHKAYGLSQVGLFSSPHLLVPQERLRFNGSPISDADACEGLSVLESRLGTKAFQDLSYFELLTILMLFEGRRRQSPLLLLEAGLGGRLDATRMAQGEVVVLTPISLEHTDLLGNTHQEILREKLGILSEKTRLLFWPPELGFAWNFSEKQLLPVIPKDLQKKFILSGLAQTPTEPLLQEGQKEASEKAAPPALKILRNTKAVSHSQKPLSYLEKNLYRAKEILGQLELYYPELLKTKKSKKKEKEKKKRKERITLHLMQNPRAAHHANGKDRPETASHRDNAIARCAKHSQIKNQENATKNNFPVKEVLPPPGRLEIRHTSLGELAFDAAHNPDAIGQSLHDFSLLLEGPLANYAVLLGILKDRPLEPCLAVLEKAGLGTEQVFLLKGQGLASLPAASPYRSIEKDDLPLLLAKLTKEGLIFLGSHRSYALFKELLEFVG